MTLREGNKMGIGEDIKEGIQEIDKIADSPNGAWKLLVFTLMCVLGMLMFLGIKGIEKSDKIVYALERLILTQEKESSLIIVLTQSVNKLSENLEIKKEIDDLKYMEFRGGSYGKPKK